MGTTSFGFNRVQYRKINRQEILDRCTILPFDIYAFNTAAKNYVLLAKKSRSITALEKFVDDIYILQEDQKEYFALTAEMLETARIDFEKTWDDQFATLETKVKHLYSYADILIENSLTNPIDKEMIKKTNGFVKMVVDLAAVNLSMIDFMQKFPDPSRYLFRHSIDVFITAATFLQILAMKTGDMSPKEVLNASMGALYHDIGMTYIPADIQNKNGPLTDDEWTLVKKHPEVGAEILRGAVEDNKLIMSETAISIALSHHERMDGSGYPLGQKGDEIPFVGRVTAICDVYNALTTNRVYRSMMTPFDAAKEMRDNMPGKFDPDLLEKFIIFLGPKQMITQELARRKLLAQ